MDNWPTYPVIYEINTWAWLSDLGREAERPVTLGNVPQAELERLAGYGFDGLWLMGVWRRSQRGRQIAREHPGLQAENRGALPDYAPEDVVGSPYAVAGYQVDPAMGGDEELAALRHRLRSLDLRLILDFVPNHLAADHGWLAQHPERLLQGSATDLVQEPGNYFEGQGRVFAHGRDPHFDGWTDTVQLDYRRPDTRRAMSDALLAIAERCDGVRCDMAMLVTRDVFLRTWGGHFDPCRAEFWPAAITDVRASQPDFLVLAEVYWDMEWELQQQGFDYTCDKRLYDRLLSGDATSVWLHLQADLAYQRRLARFIENHDERRALAAFGPQRSRAVATLALTLPGLRLLHEGQLEGRRLKLPVQLGRRQSEPPEPGLEPFYRRLLAALRHPVFHDGDWRLLEPQAQLAGNASDCSIVAQRWVLGEEVRLAAVNLSPGPAQCFLRLDLSPLAGQPWQLQDLLSDVHYVRDGDELLARGFHMELPGYGYRFFRLQPLTS
ncbi:MAG: alpha-amylase [Anaerolineae bacterium]|nr:MAG: alpha-amylase [Anaerolineae bacterium]